MSQGQKCEVDCSGEEPGTFKPDPFDCHNYYGCLSDGSHTDTPNSCDEGYYFSPANSSCIVTNSTCEPLCEQRSCALTCHGSADFIANPYNCSEFYACSPSGEAISGSCTLENPYFDGQNCVGDKIACCDPCIPYCPAPGLEVVDPEDCTKYYFCDSNSELVPFECEEDDYFDIVSGQCVSNQGVACENLCYMGVVIPPYNQTYEEDIH